MEGAADYDDAGVPRPLADVLRAAEQRECIVLEGTDLSNGPTAEVIFCAIADTHAHTLQDLRLPACCLGNAGVAHLARTIVRRCSSLSVLDLHGNAIGDVGADTIASAIMSTPDSEAGSGCRLRELRIASNCLTDSGCVALIHAMASLPSVRLVDISDNAFGNDTANAIARLIARLPAQGLEATLLIDASHGSIDDTGAAAIADALDGRREDLARSAKSDHVGAVHLALDLRANAIGRRGARALRRAIDACTPVDEAGVVFVDIRWN